MTAIERQIAIFDVDGTLSDNSHRQHFLRQMPKDWDEFYAQMPLDSPNEPLVLLFKALRAAGMFELVVVSARPERFRKETDIWLQRHELRYSRLFMRKDGDFRADHVVKREMIHLISPDISRIAFVVDDRRQTVEMWRDMDLLCLQCADHNY